MAGFGTGNGATTGSGAFIPRDSDLVRHRSRSFPDNVSSRSQSENLGVGSAGRSTKTGIALTTEVDESLKPLQKANPRARNTKGPMIAAANTHRGICWRTGGFFLPIRSRKLASRKTRRLDGKQSTTSAQIASGICTINNGEIHSANIANSKTTTKYVVEASVRQSAE